MLHSGRKLCLSLCTRGGCSEGRHRDAHSPVGGKRSSFSGSCLVGQGIRVTERHRQAVLAPQGEFLVILFPHTCPGLGASFAHSPARWHPWVELRVLRGDVMVRCHALKGVRQPRDSPLAVSGGDGISMPVFSIGVGGGEGLVGLA